MVPWSTTTLSATRGLGIVGAGKIQMSGNGTLDGPARLGTGSQLGITTGNVIGGGLYGLSLVGDPKGNTVYAVDQTALDRRPRRCPERLPGRGLATSPASNT